MITQMNVNDAPRLLQKQLIVKDNQDDCCDGGITAIVKNIFCFPCFLHQKIGHKRDFKQVSTVLEAVNKLMVSEDALKEMSDEDKLTKIQSQNEAIRRILKTLPDKFETTKYRYGAQTVKAVQKIVLSERIMNDPRLRSNEILRKMSKNASKMQQALIDEIESYPDKYKVD